MRSLFSTLHTPSGFHTEWRPAPAPVGRANPVFWLGLCLLAGALQAGALAWPLQSWSLPGSAPGQASGWLQIASLALLVLALQRSKSLSSAAWRGWVFATAWLAFTCWWLFVSMYTYAGLPAWLAALAVLALTGALALFYSAAAAAWWTWAPASRSAQALLFAALWTLAELARGRWLSGFPWGAGGYAQVDLMAAWAPWVGVYGMGFLAALLAFALASLLNRSRWPALPSRSLWAKLRAALALLLLLPLLASLWGGGASWRHWAERGSSDSGELRVWLLQGNISQGEKFVPGTGIEQALTWYPQQIAAAVQAARSGAATAPHLVVAPETALPLLPQQIGADFWRELLGQLAQPDVGAPVSALIGMPLGDPLRGYTNSAWGLQAASAQRALASLTELGENASEQALAQWAHRAGFYRYDKYHLVPFGEFIPPLFGWFVELMDMPLGDFQRGALPQPPWTLDGQRIATNICYEDLFGEELAASFRDPANAPTLLVNLSNIAWFGDTVAIDQHLQISRLRALELGRPMLRATNTGATAAIDHRGVVTHKLPRLTRDRLEVTLQGRTGLTPYARWAAHWGLWPLWTVCLSLVLLIAVALPRRPPGGR